MFDRVRVRCRVCGSAVPATVLWATADTCPGCLNPLQVPYHPGRNRETTGIAIALRRSQIPQSSSSPHDFGSTDGGGR